MKIKTFIEKIESLEPYDIQRFFEKDYDGACPCFSGKKTIDGHELKVWGRCWRVSEHFGRQDLYIWSDFHSNTTRKIAGVIRKKLSEQKWYNKYRIIYKKDFEV